jgi:hypothetical protein
MAQRRTAMRDRDHGAISESLADNALNQLIRCLRAPSSLHGSARPASASAACRIDRRRGFIDEQDRRGLENGARDADLHGARSRLRPGVPGRTSWASPTEKLPPNSAIRVSRPCTRRRRRPDRAAARRTDGTAMRVQVFTFSSAATVFLSCTASRASQTAASSCSLNGSRLYLWASFKVAAARRAGAPLRTAASR